MKKIPVEKLRPGMTYDKAVYIDSGNMLVAPNVEISEKEIKKLMLWGVTVVETAGELVNDKAAKEEETYKAKARRIVETYNDLLKKRKKLIEVHNKACLEVGLVYSALKNDQPFSIDGIEESARKIIQLLNENNNIFLFLYGLGEDKDYLVVHSVNVTFYSLIIGSAMKYSMTDLIELGMGTLIIDSGMVMIPLYITQKKSDLTEQELKQIKTHPLHGYKHLVRLGKVKEKIANITLQHHEQFDGRGYPRGIKGSAISEFARIATIADSYEAQISSRSYREKVYFYHAMKNLLSSGINKFDPVILKEFLSRMSVYPIGSIVELNDLRIGIVIGSAPEKPLRPIIKLVYDKDRKRISETEIISLLEETSLYIVRAVDDLDVNIFDIL